MTVINGGRDGQQQGSGEDTVAKMAFDREAVTSGEAGPPDPVDV